MQAPSSRLSEHHMLRAESWSPEDSPFTEEPWLGYTGKDPENLR